MNWQLQEAKSKLSQVVNCALRDGPQFITRHGKEAVVVLSVEDYRNLVGPNPTLLDLLLDSPLRGSGLDTKRDREDFGRDSTL